jgi:hypothetical protein
MEEADLEIKKQQIEAETNLCISGLYGRRQSDPTAKQALANT